MIGLSFLFFARSPEFGDGLLYSKSSRLQSILTVAIVETASRNVFAVDQDKTLVLIKSKYLLWS